MAKIQNEERDKGLRKVGRKKKKSCEAEPLRLNPTQKNKTEKVVTVHCVSKKERQSERLEWRSTQRSNNLISVWPQGRKGNLRKNVYMFVCPAVKG